MRTVVLTSTASKSSACRERSEGRGDYFPFCRKDTNCHCEICLESINATRDLIPSGSSIQQSSLTKLSSSGSTMERTPRLLDFQEPTTPEMGKNHLPIQGAAVLCSTAKSRPPEKGMHKKEKRNWVLGYRLLRVIAGLCLVFMLDSGTPAVVTRVFGRPRLTADVVRSAGEESRVAGNLRGRLGILQEILERAVGGRISNCSSVDSKWELSQDGYLFISKCVLYKSMAEDVSIWGCPLQTSGLLITGFSPRSLTVLSGRVSEWYEGKLKYAERMGNSSWVHRKRSNSLVQLQPNTWILEYHRNPVLENSRVYTIVWELLRHHITHVVQELWHNIWLQQEGGSPYHYRITAEENLPQPT